jgi:hypothetical protein
MSNYAAEYFHAVLSLRATDPRWGLAAALFESRCPESAFHGKVT